MNNRTPIVNISGDYEESLIQLASHLGKNSLRRKLFNAVYGRGEKPKSKKQIMDCADISQEGTNAQQAQNELEHLAKHHLISKVSNDGSVEDRSRYLYGKDPTVRANREKIVGFADNPSRAAKVATKRNPSGRPTAPPPLISRSKLRKKKKLVVLYLTANPYSDALKSDPEALPLRVDLEVRLVQDAIRRSIFRDNVRVEYRPGADLQSLIDGLNDHRPQIVHFSGHSGPTDLSLDNQSLEGPDFESLPYSLLAKAITSTDIRPKVIVLNSCDSLSALQSLKGKIDVLIGMTTSISDVAASVFAPQFYAALASGQSIQSAYSQAVVAVEAASISEQDTIKISFADGVDPLRMKMV
ncbi:MAG: CHAT domain-containing protein [Phyllobacteriaceae bacterium]|nr:CHAT domain-containing protein [Phyllobacteriaceae bacterium]